METTPSSTMDEILAGYTGEGKYESTMNDLNEFEEFMKGVLDAVLKFVEYIKSLLG